MKSIEALPPGLYGMEIEERKGPEGVTYKVHFPVNPDFDPIVLGRRDQDQVRVIAEVVEVLGTGNARAHRSP